MPDPARVLTGWAAALQTRKAAAERDVVGSILAGPARGIDLAERAGLEARHFDQPDIQAIYLAIVVKRQTGRLSGDRLADQVAVLKLARAALRDAGHWDQRDTRPFVCGSLWSDFSLAALADLYPSPAPTLVLAAHLIDLSDRLAYAEWLAAELADVLTRP